MIRLLLDPLGVGLFVAACVLGAAAEAAQKMSDRLLAAGDPRGSRS